MTTAASRTRWFPAILPSPDPRLRLFCFPYAGGGLSIFHAWPEGLPRFVEVRSLQLPGRGGRLAEPPFTRLRALAQAATNALAAEQMDDKPFAFFGHSLGALLGFEMARLLRRKGGPRPLCLLVSGCRAPHVPDTRAPIHELPEPEFLEELRHLNGSPPEALEHAELMQMLLPCLRADFETYATYVYEHEPPLDCPIHAFGGQNDVEVPPEALAAWGEQTGAAFSLRLLPGDHFFVNTARSLLLELLSRELRQIVVGTPVREAK